jgi:hypothetical protein
MTGSWRDQKRTKVHSEVTANSVLMGGKETTQKPGDDFLTHYDINSYLCPGAYHLISEFPATRWGL